MDAILVPMRAWHVAVLVLAAGGCASTPDVTPPVDDPTQPAMRVHFFDFPPQDGSDTENPKTYSSLPTRIRGTPTTEVTVKASVTDPESGVIWARLWTVYVISCVLPDGSPGKQFEDDREAIFGDADVSGNRFEPDPKPPYPVERFVELKIPLIHRRGGCPPEQRTLMFPVTVTVNARAGNGVEIAQSTQIVPDRPGRW